MRFLVKSEKWKVNSEKVKILNAFAFRIFGGGRWIRTIEVVDNRFTVCPLWPLGNSPIFGCAHFWLLELVDGLEPPTCWLQISCSTNWAIPASQTSMVIIAKCIPLVKNFFSFLGKEEKDFPFALLTFIMEKTGQSGFTVGAGSPGPKGCVVESASLGRETRPLHSYRQVMRNNYQFSP